MTSELRRAGPRRAALGFVFITVTLDMLALGIIIPVLPKLVLQLSGGSTAHAAHIVGLFGTAWALMQFACSPLAGALSDRFGRRPVILLSNLGLGLDYVLMATGPTLTWLFAGRLISGVTSASIGAAGAYIADVLPPEKRAKGFGMLGVAFGLGFVLGPAVGGLLGSASPRLPFWVAGGVSLLNAFYGFFVLPESLAKEHRAAFEWRRANPFGQLALIRQHRPLLGLLGVNFLGNVAHAVLPSTFVLYATYRYGWDERAVGLTLAGVGITSAVVQGGLVGPVVSRFGERRTLIVGLAFGAVGFLVYGLAATGLWFFVGVPVMALWGLAGPAAQGLLTAGVGPTEQGKLQGLTSSLNGIAELIGPGLFTLTFAAFIDPGRGVHLPGASFLLAALILLGASLLAVRVTRVRRPARPDLPHREGKNLP